MKIIVDTNVVFSSILNFNSKISYLLFNSNNVFEFYSVNFLLFEIKKHKDKIKKIKNITEEEFTVLIELLKNKIIFIDEKKLKDEVVINSIEILKNTDLNDVYFLALSFDMNAKVWTGDKKFIKCLTDHNMDNYITTEQILNIYINNVTY